MSRESPPPIPERVFQDWGWTESKATRRKRTPRLFNKAGTIAVIGMAAWSAWNLSNKSGEYDHISPRTNRAAAIDNVMRMISWNMHGQTATRYPQIKMLAKKYRPDAIVLQEVTSRDTRVLQKRFPGWDKAFVWGDLKQHPLQGGYGNVIMTAQKPKGPPQTKSLAGTSLKDSTARVILGFGQDVANANPRFTKTKDGLQESRAAIAETIQVRKTDGSLADVRIMTAHIAGYVDTGLHEKQFTGLFNFMRDNASDTRPLIMCGDLNADNNEVIPAAAERGLISPVMEATSVSGNPIDHCAYDGGDVLDVGSVEVLRGVKTDHYPIMGTWSAR